MFDSNEYRASFLARVIFVAQVRALGSRLTPEDLVPDSTTVKKKD